MAPRTGRGKLRGNGDGALYFSQALDRWVGVATVPDPAAKDGRRRIKVTGTDKATAKTKLDDALRKIGEGAAGRVREGNGRRHSPGLAGTRPGPQENQEREHDRRAHLGRQQTPGPRARRLPAPRPGVRARRGHARGHG